jgi:hypothetical protein
VCVSMRRNIIVTVCVLFAMFLAQAAWESPLRPFVWWLTTPGCGLAWLIAKPDYDKNSTVLVFDTIATVVNTAVYFAALWLAKAAYLRWRNSDRNLHL